MSNEYKTYDQVITQCKTVFADKVKDYGTSWRVLRASSLTDQLYIKAQRIRTLQEVKEAKINEGIDGEFQAIVNYSIMACIQLSINNNTTDLNLSIDNALKLYDQQANTIRELMIAKNHDYGAAWQSMRVSSITDMILMKLLRIKQIEDNDGQTIISEGIESHYMDCCNYAIFALLLRSI